MKLAELQKKYIVPLQKLKEKNAQKKSGEMKRIDEVLDVLMSSRKIKMDNLVSIESVLFKLFTNKSSSSADSGSVERPPMSADKAAHSAAGKNLTMLTLLHFIVLYRVSHQTYTITFRFLNAPSHRRVS